MSPFVFSITFPAFRFTVWNFQQQKMIEEIKIEEMTIEDVTDEVENEETSTEKAKPNDRPKLKPVKIIDLTGDGGVVKKVLRRSTLEERPIGGCEVTIHYVGRLSDGTKFFSTHDNNEAFTYKLGSCMYIFICNNCLFSSLLEFWFKCILFDLGVGVKAFDIAVGSMRIAEFAEFTVHPDYAYGARGAKPTIPPNETLTLEVKL